MATTGYARKDGALIAISTAARRAASGPDACTAASGNANANGKDSDKASKSKDGDKQ